MIEVDQESIGLMSIKKGQDGVPWLKILKRDGLGIDDDELLGPSTKGYVILSLKKDACESREEAIQPFYVR